VKQTSKFYHKVLVIGDSVAAGFGDYVTCLAPYGITRHLAVMVSKEHTVRQSWVFMNAGVCGSTSDDWHPDCKSSYDTSRSNGRFLGVLDGLLFRRRPLWRETFDDPSYNDAEIVIVCVGLEDSKYGVEAKNPIRTRDNVRVICNELRARGKEVILCTLPLRWRLQDTKKNEVFVKDKERNELLAGVIVSMKDPHLNLGCDLGSPEFCRQQLYTADAVHFCSEGYRKFASSIFTSLVPAMVRVEAKTWKQFIK